MPEEKIKGGYILFARKFLDSGIMDKPPLWSKLFLWMLLKANRTDGYKGLKPGEFYTNIREMRDAMTHFVGYRKETPTPKQIRRVYEGLSRGTAGGTAKGTGETIKVSPLKGNRGVKITILNYEAYQDPKNYEGHRKKTVGKPHERPSEKFTKDDCRAHLYSKQEAYKKNKKIYQYLSAGMIDFVVGFIFYIQAEKPKFSPALTRTHLELSYKTIIDLCRLDAFDFEYVQKVVRWAKTDMFWSDNLQSLATLRKKSKSNGLKKFQNMAKSYESSKKRCVNGKNTNFTGNDQRESILPDRMPEYH